MTPTLSLSSGHATALCSSVCGTLIFPVTAELISVALYSLIFPVTVELISVALYSLSLSIIFSCMAMALSILADGSEYKIKFHFAHFLEEQVPGQTLNFAITLRIFLQIAIFLYRFQKLVTILLAEEYIKPNTSRICRLPIPNSSTNNQQNPPLSFH